jgi:multicomponent K+:H+ antiporter subunit F
MSALLSTMTFVAIGCYSVAMAIALWRVMRGPTAQDRVLALDFISVNGMLVTMVVGIRFASTLYFEAALLLALFGFVGSTAMAKFLLRGEIVA